MLMIFFVISLGIDLWWLWTSISVPFWNLFGIIFMFSATDLLMICLMVFWGLVIIIRPKMNPDSIDCDHPFSTFVQTLICSLIVDGFWCNWEQFDSMLVPFWEQVGTILYDCCFNLPIVHLQFSIFQYVKCFIFQSSIYPFFNVLISNFPFS